MKLKRMKTSEIHFAPYNPRYISEYEFEKLKQSIEKFGLVEPLVVNKRNNNVVGGNQRLKAIKELGINEVDVVEVDLNEDEEKALNVALNKISGEWDIEKLEDIFEGLDEDLLELTGFDELEIEDILKNTDLEEIDEIKPEKQEPEIFTCPKCGAQFTRDEME